MKTLLKVLAAIALVAMAAPAQALTGEDEQWSNPNNPQLGYHEITIEDNGYRTPSYSQLTGYKGSESFICHSLTDVDCSDATSFDAQQSLGVCSAENNNDCIESLTAIDSTGKEYPAVFKEYIYYNHPTAFTGDGIKVVKNPLGPANWTIEGATHAHGNMYTLAVNSKSKVGNAIKYDDFNLTFYPTEYGESRGEVADRNGALIVPMCYTKISPAGLRNLFCSQAGTSGTYKCAFYMQKGGTCLLQRPFPSDFRFKVVIRLSAEPTGFFHGRLDNPNIEISKLTSGGVTFALTSGAVKVPTIYHGLNWSSAVDELKNHWDTCLRNGTCMSGTRQAGLNNQTESDGNKRNALYSPLAYEYAAFSDVEFFRKFVDDTAVANPSALNLRTLSQGEMAGANACFSNGSGLKGIVTTNSSVYSAGPPKLSDGQLTYKVAGLHYLPDGKTPAEGSYDLVLKSEVARCIYGFTKAPIQATISVISAEGETKTATTKVFEENGWLKLSARGYTYSSPTINVKLSQPSASKKTTITCVKGKLTKKVTAVAAKCPVGYKKK